MIVAEPEVEAAVRITNIIEIIEINIIHLVAFQMPRLFYFIPFYFIFYLQLLVYNW